ncbi:hypothetical protein E0F75_038635, partial [Streptomyces sp. CB02980]|uniref:hypothetical protein n=1 Tax=Streptomyces sp. CB02980 TaxID=2542736 RepID=UPI001E3AE7BD
SSLPGAGTGVRGARRVAGSMPVRGTGITRRLGKEILGTALGSSPTQAESGAGDGYGPPSPTIYVAVNSCGQTPLKPHQSHLVGLQIF